MTPEQAKTLAQIEQKLTDICASNAKEHADLKKQIDSNLEMVQKTLLNMENNRTTRTMECEKKFDDRPKMILFRLLALILIPLALYMAAYVTNIDMKLDAHIERSKIVFHQLTGEVYDPLVPFSNVEPFKK